MKRRVVVTGVGALTPIGNSASDTWESAKAGVCGIAPISFYDTADRRVKLAAEIKNYDVDAQFDRKDAKRMARFTKLAKIVPAGPALRRVLEALLDGVIRAEYPNEKPVLLAAAQKISAS